MKRNVVELVLGAVVLAVAAVFLAFSMQAADVGGVSKGYQVSATFSDIGSLAIGSDVRLSGVKIGTVSAIVLDPESYLAKVTMTLDPVVKLPDDSSASVSSQGLLGGNLMTIQPGGSEDYIADGGRIEYTQNAQNLETLLGQFIFSLQGKDDAS